MNKKTYLLAVFATVISTSLFAQQNKSEVVFSSASRNHAVALSTVDQQESYKTDMIVYNNDSKRLSESSNQEIKTKLNATNSKEAAIKNYKANTTNKRQF